VLYRTDTDHSQRVNLTTRLGGTLYFQHLRFRHHSCSSTFPEPRAARIGMGNCSRQPSSTSGVDRSRPSCIRWCSVNYAPLCRCARRKTGHYRHLWCKSLRSFCAAVFWPMASLEYVAVTVVMIGWSDSHASEEVFVPVATVSGWQRSPLIWWIVSLTRSL